MTQVEQPKITDSRSSISPNNLVVEVEVAASKNANGVVENGNRHEDMEAK